MNKSDVKIRETNILKSLCMSFLNSNNNKITISEKDISFINKCIRELAKCEKIIRDEDYPSSSSYKLDFDFESMEDTTNGYYIPKSDKCTIRLKNNVYIAGNVYTRDEIAKKILSQLNTIFHEFKHYEQMLEMTSEGHDSFMNYRMAQEEAIRQSGNMGLIMYKQNYWTMLNELESRFIGMKKIDELIESLGENNKYRDILIKNRRISDEAGYIYNIHDIAPRVNEAGEYQEIETFRTQKLDEVISKDSSILQKYPILKYRYNEDGTRKSILNLLKLLWNIKDNNIDGRIVIEALTETVEDATIDELEKIDTIYPDGKSLYDFLYKENMNRYEQEKKMIKNIKESHNEGFSYANSFIDNRLEPILDSKYKRRLEMLEMYKEKKYKEGYNLINYNLINGVDLPYRESSNACEFENMVRDIWIRENILDVYNHIETDSDYLDRNRKEKDYITLVLSAVETKRIPDDFINKFDLLQKNYTSSNFKDLACILKVADSLSLYDGRNYLVELYSIPEIKNICDKMQKSNIYKEAVEESKTKPQKVKKSLLDYHSDIANNDLRESGNARKILEDMQSQNEISKYDSVGKVALWRIINIQKGYSIRIDGEKMRRSETPELLINRQQFFRTLSMNDIVKSAITIGISMEQVQRANKVIQPQIIKEEVELDD